MPTAPSTILASGVSIPRIGLGTWPMDDAEAERAVATAVKAGYRLFDTAENYRNERGVGLGLKASGVRREDLFVTTKFNREWHGEDLVREAFGQRTKRLGLDYLDLMLIHWPNPSHGRYVEAWKGLIRLQEEGLVRSIGVSNFKPAHIDRLIEETGVTPDVNQVQLHPFLPRDDVRAYHAEHGITTETWSPLGKGSEELMQQQVVLDLARQYDRTPAQIVLRWHMELGLIPIPKSSDPARQRENIEVFGFRLEPAEVQAIHALNDPTRAPADSDRVGH